MWEGVEGSVLGILGLRCGPSMWRSIDLLRKYLLSTYSVPHTVLRPWDTALNQPTKDLCAQGIYLLMGGGEGRDLIGKKGLNKIHTISSHMSHWT